MKRDSLPHTVNVERMERTILIFSAEQLQGLVLRSSGEHKERQILMLTVDDNLPVSYTHLDVYKRQLQ